VSVIHHGGTETRRRKNTETRECRQAGAACRHLLAGCVGRKRSRGPFSSCFPFKRERTADSSRPRRESGQAAVVEPPCTCSPCLFNSGSSFFLHHEEREGHAPEIAPPAALEARRHRTEKKGRFACTSRCTSTAGNARSQAPCSYARISRSPALISSAAPSRGRRMCYSLPGTSCLSPIPDCVPKANVIGPRRRTPSIVLHGTETWGGPSF